MRTLADGVHQLKGTPPNAINVYLVGDILADVFFNIRKPAAPPGFLTIDPALNRASMRRMAELRPALTLFGHGAPLRDPARLAAAAGL